MIGLDKAHGMRDVWCWAFSWFLRPPSSAEKRAKQAELVQAIKTGLSTCATVRDLHLTYSADSRWCLEIARRLFPAEWPALGIHACTAAAYGLRFVELMTGRELDAREALPKWAGEWAIW